jgi:hypothetical protein
MTLKNPFIIKPNLFFSISRFFRLISKQSSHSLDEERLIKVTASNRGRIHISHFILIVYGKEDKTLLTNDGPHGISIP